ncbi:MAG TPA: META domain-containing protein [Sulfurimonas sp.]|nr:META domain-containing protein [Sulfurimonas sp.]
MSHFILILSLVFLISCSSPIPDKPLKGTYWRLIKLKGQDLQSFDHQPYVHLFFHINDTSVHGSNGCNTLQAKYSQKNEAFSFRKIVFSNASCEEGKEQSQIFDRILKKTNRLLIRGDQLFLYNSDQKIAQFEIKEDY